MRRQTTGTAEDEALATQIKIALRQASMTGGLPIDAQADSGVVTLRGTVDRPEQKEAAVQLAQGVLGVRQVVDELEVRTPEEP